MSNELICYHKFRNDEEAAIFVDVLQENKIEFRIINTNPVIDPVLAGSYYEPALEIHIPPQQFERADELMIRSLQIDIEQVDKDYYLLSFSDKELIEVLQKSDEWSKYDYALAVQLLKKRNVNISDDELKQLKKKRVEVLAEPEKEGSYKVSIGYFFSLLGGFAGILIGYILWQSKKILPNGERVFVYDQKARDHGKKIFFIGIVVLLALYIANQLEWIDIPFFTPRF
jgi:hypothetical protein